MPTLPTPWLVHIERKLVGGDQAAWAAADKPWTESVDAWQEATSPQELNPHGYATAKYAEPEPLWVHAISDGPSKELVDAGGNTDEIAKTVYAPSHAQVGYEDRVVIDGIKYEVAGSPKDWTRGPWLNPIAGIEISLRLWRS